MKAYSVHMACCLESVPSVAIRKLALTLHSSFAAKVELFSYTHLINYFPVYLLTLEVLFNLFTSSVITEHHPSVASTLELGCMLAGHKRI